MTHDEILKPDEIHIGEGRPDSPPTSAEQSSPAA